MFTSFDLFLLNKQPTSLENSNLLFKARIDSTSNWINNQLFPVDSAIGFSSTYPLVSDLFAGQHFPTFELLGHEWL